VQELAAAKWVFGLLDFDNDGELNQLRLHQAERRCCWLSSLKLPKPQSLCMIGWVVISSCSWGLHQLVARAGEHPACTHGHVLCSLQGRRCIQPDSQLWCVAHRWQAAGVPQQIAVAP
jgi:hypothetical protein